MAEVKETIKIDLNLSKQIQQVTSLQKALSEADGTIANIKNTLRDIKTERLTEISNTIRVLQSSLNKGTNLRFNTRDINILSKIYEKYVEKQEDLIDAKEKLASITKLITAVESNGIKNAQDQRRLDSLKEEQERLQNILGIREKINEMPKLKEYSTFKERMFKPNLRGTFGDIDNIFGLSDKKYKAELNMRILDKAGKGGSQEMAAAKGMAKGAGTMIAILAIIQAIYETAKKIANWFNNIFKSTIGISLSLKDIFGDILADMQEILSITDGMMTYNTTQSLITNRAAREQQMRYGISASQNWALSQVKDVLGMQDEEDFMYMNRQQKALFDSLMNRYQNWYEELNRNGTLAEVQQFQIEFQLLKQQLAMDFLKWFAKNKDTILSAIKFIANVVMSIAKFIESIVEMLGKNKSEGTVSAVGVGVMSDYLTYSRGNNKNVNVTINQTNNASGVITDTSEWEELIEENNQKMIKQLYQDMGA